jgi:hypothetical protein
MPRLDETIFRGSRSRPETDAPYEWVGVKQRGNSHDNDISQIRPDNSVRDVGIRDAHRKPRF